MAPAFFPVEPGQLLVLPEWLRLCAEPIESERRPVSVRRNIAHVAPPFVEACGLLSKESLARVPAQLSGLSWRDGLVRGSPHAAMRNPTVAAGEGRRHSVPTRTGAARASGRGRRCVLLRMGAAGRMGKSCRDTLIR